ncbi:MAG: outer membrane protein transport protein [Burkholderiales bacterium]|nr:outer membrane protein transport protein [Burkholderiales bacterium]
MNNASSSIATFNLRPLAVALILGGSLTSAFATNGYFSHGYGMKAKGMGGASVAMTDNAFAGANNPAVAAWAGNRVEVGVDMFMPKRGMERTGGTALGAIAVDSDSNTFYVPEFGYNREISKQLGVGITVYGNGGMNTDYAGGQINCGAGAANVLCGSGRLGVNLEQLIIAPTIAYKVSDSHSFGVSPLIVRQTFKADGLQAFAAPTSTSNPAAVTNNGNDTSSGYGIRLGYLGKVSDALNIGVSYSPKIAMSKFSQYAGLFAEAGGFDIPANLTVGFSFQATPEVTIAADYQSIKYSGVPSIANPSNAIASGIPLGAANGSGFGWSDVNAVKIGVQWRASQKLTMRAGVNVGDNPVKSADVTFNILAPGVVTTHYTVGGTYAMSDKSEVTMSYMFAPSNSVTGSSLYNTLMGPGVAGNETVKMSQQAIGIQFGWKF